MLSETDKETIARIDALIATAKTSWFGLLSYFAFVGVTLMGVQDADFFIPSRETQLPLIGVSVPTSLFFYVAPGLGAAIYAYFHLHLIKLWEPLGTADAKLDDAPLSDHIAPWLIADFALSTRSDGAVRPRALARLANGVTLLLAFWSAPLVLAAFWFRSMPKHDEWLTVICIGGPLIAAIYVGKTSFEQMRLKMTAKTNLTKRVEWCAVGILISFFGMLASNGTNDQDPKIKDLLREFGFPRPAQLAGVDFVKTPQNRPEYAESRIAYREVWCDSRDIPKLVCGQGGSLLTNVLQHARKRWCQLNLPADINCQEQFREFDVAFATSWRIQRGVENRLLNPIDLSQADFRGANLKYARLEGANLDGARLQGSTLDYAYLEDAELNFANLAGASLKGTKLQRAYLWDAWMDGADLSNARLEEAELWDAWMNRVDLTKANLKEAGLLGTQMKGANLSEADLTGVRLWEASLSGANLSNVRMEEADIRNMAIENSTNFQSTTLEEAMLDNVDIGHGSLGQEQIDSAFGDANVILPPDLNRPSHWPDQNLDQSTLFNEWWEWKEDPASYIPPQNR